MPDSHGDHGVNSHTKTSAVSPRLIFTNPAMLLAFGFGSGLVPKAPGTAGTLVAIPIALMLSHLPLVAALGVIVALFVVGVFLCDYATNRLGVHDHSGIVWDEIVGYLIAVVFVPATWFSLLLGFAGFRLFDIVKPWPIRELDHRMSGGLGIMLDDVVAGIFAAAVVVAVEWGRHML